MLRKELDLKLNRTLGLPGGEQGHQDEEGVRHEVREQGGLPQAERGPERHLRGRAPQGR